ncbi:MAG: ComEC/Rec2 family competence protein [Phycisphaerales bacterium]
MVARSAPEIASSIWFGAACLLLAAAWLLGELPTRLTLAAAVVALGAGWFQLRINERPAGSIAAFLDEDPLAEPVLILVRGFITESPRSRPPPGGEFTPEAALSPGVRWTMEADSILSEQGDIPVNGSVRVSFAGPIDLLPGFVRAGASIEVRGRLGPIRGARNPGEPPRDLILAGEGIVASMAVAGPDDLRAQEHDGAFRRARGELLSLRESLRARTMAAVMGESPAERFEGGARGRALAAAMLFGEREPALSEVEPLFRRTGLMHLVAISGVNMALLAWLALVAVRLTGDRGWLEPAACASVVLAYMAVLPGESSILRSGIGLLVILAAEAGGRRYDRLTLLGWVAVGLVVHRPMELWSLGFQLSFGVAAALIVLAPRVHERVWGVPILGLVPTPVQRSLWHRGLSLVLDHLKLALTASVVAWAVAMPIIAQHSGVVSPLSPLASLIVLPAAMVLLWVGYACVLAVLLAPAAAVHTSALLARLGDASVWMVEHIDEWPGACFHLPRISAAWAAGATGLVVWWLWRGRARERAGWGMTAALAAWLIVAVWSEGTTPRRSAACLDVLAMGEGSCVLVRSGRDRMLVGCGAYGGWPRAEDVRRAVRELGAWRVPTVVIPGCSPEFWSLTPELVEPLGVRTVLVPEGFADAARNAAMDEARLVRALTDRGVRVRVVTEGDVFAFGGVGVRFVGRSRTSLITRVEKRGEVDGGGGAGGGESAALIAEAATHAQVQSLRPGDRRASLLILPQRSGSGERVDQTIEAVGATMAVLDAGRSESRRWAQAGLRGRVRLTGEEGWVGAGLASPAARSR